MADTDALPPLEIPWRLASTTQPLSTGEPAPTALSLFYFEPDDAAIVERFPDEKLVFVKITASVSPGAFPAELSKTAATYLGEGIPCMHLLLDLKVRAEGDGANGAIRPYFHAAAPLTRRMVQTGVVGVEAYEGEADGLAIGKSGAQMNETLRSHSSSTTASASAGLTIPIPVVSSLLSVGGSIRNTSTDVASDRAVSQSVDTMNRQASEERRELVSHTTRVENIISLLATKYIGTPYLSFSVSPQPLQQLSMDAADPNLWFQQLLARRSSGIEGVQEFTAVIVVPKSTNFCINARLRRVCLLDSPPGPLSFEERFNGSLLQLARMVNYLNRTFPPGTPLEELDIDIIGSIQPGGTFKRPVVELWGLRLLERLVVASVASPSATAGAAQHGNANYKHFLEVWIDTLRDEYDREAARSPLERGILFGENRFLDTCFGIGEDDEIDVTSSNASVSPLFRVPLHVGILDIGGVKSLSSAKNASVRARALETTTRWNVVERHVTNLLANSKSLGEEPLVASHPKVMTVLLDVWRKLPADDPRNLDFEKAASLLKLSDVQRKQFAAAGAENLSGIATALTVLPDMERQNEQAKRVRAVTTKGKGRGATPELINVPLDAKARAVVLAAIASSLGSR